MNEHPPACLHEDRWQEIRKDIAEIKEIALDTHGRMFIGNGTPAMSTRVDRLERILGLVSCAVGAVIMAGLISGAATLFHHLFRTNP